MSEDVDESVAGITYVWPWLQNYSWWAKPWGKGGRDIGKHFLILLWNQMRTSGDFKSYKVRGEKN